MPERLEIGDLVMWNGNVEDLSPQTGVVLDVDLIRYHSYLPQEQVATVLWENGGTREVSSLNLRVIEDDSVLSSR